MALSSTIKRLQPFYAAFICFSATTLMFSPNTSIYRAAVNAEFIQYFIFPMFAALLIVAGAAAVRSRQHRLPENLPKRLGLACGAIYVVSSLMFGVFSYQTDFTPLAPVVAGALCGATVVPVCLQWARHLALLDYRDALLYSAPLCVGSSLASMTMALMPAVPKIACFALCLIVGTLTPFLKESRVSPTETALSIDGSRASDASPASIAPEPASSAAISESSDVPSTADLASTLRLPAISLLLYAFMMSINKFLAFDLFDSEYVGDIIAALCILPLFLVHTDKPLSSLIYRVIAPIIGGVVIVLSSLPTDFGMHSITLFCVYVFLSALAILALAQIIAVMHAGEFSTALVTNIALTLGGSVSLCGLIWTHYFGGLDDYTPIIFVMISVYCAVMLISLGLETWRLMNNAPDERGGHRELADARMPKPIYGELTNRETEILTYLGRGHSIIYIAEKLFISESTVRTHVKHIYAKLGIHSREELFALIDQSH